MILIYVDSKRVQKNNHLADQVDVIIFKNKALCGSYSVQLDVIYKYTVA